MERLKQRYEMLTKALTALKEEISLFWELNPGDKYYKSLRTSVIKSFEFSQDTFWKFLKEYLEVIEQIEPIGSPKAVFKKCLDLDIISLEEYKISLDICEDRNLGVHTYNETLAETIAEEIPQYYTEMQKITDRIGKLLPN